MKGRTLSVLGIIALAIGAVLVIFHQNLSLAGVTIFGGVVFVAVGLINLLFMSGVTHTEGALARVLTLVANAASIVLGCSMLVYNATFVPLIAFMFALLVAVCSLWQFFILAVGTRPHQLPAWLYLVPVAIGAGAVYSFFIKGPGSDAMVFLVTGISMCVMGAGCLIEGSALGMARRKMQRQQAEMSQAEVPADHTLPNNAAAGQPTSATDSSSLAIHDEAPSRPGRVETTEDLDDEFE